LCVLFERWTDAGVKDGAASADHTGMDFVHTCTFCGWSRSSETPVLLPAGCPSCGCPVDSLPRAEAQQRAEAAADAALAPAFSVPRSARLPLVAVALLFVVMAARVGYGVLGTNGAIIAVGMAGFLLLPFAPERVGSARAA
jgi:hypothetical protein